MSKVTELEKKDLRHLGGCSDLLTRKGQFIEKRKQYNIGNGVSSKDWQRNIDNHIDDLADFLDPSQLSRMSTRVEHAALDIGVYPPSYWEGELPFENKTYMFILDWVLAQTKLSIKNSISEMDRTGESIPVSFNLSSSVGFVPEIPGIKETACAHSAATKRSILDYFGQMDAESMIKMDPDPVIPVGYRAQADTQEKRGLRPALLLSTAASSALAGEGETESKRLLFMEGVTYSHVFNDHDGYRIRPVAGFPWHFNISPIAINQLIFAGLSPFLKHVWKFTHEDILTKYKGRFIVCTDISNNDQNFIPEENVYIHENLLPPDTFKKWLHVQDKASIYGSYIDKDENLRYYKMDADSTEKPLLSGEGLTSIVNKIKHTAMQLYNHRILDSYEKASSVPELRTLESINLFESMNDDEIESWFNTISLSMTNNGDDTIDAFDSQAEADEFAIIATTNPYAIIGLEPPSFSGISIELTDGKVSDIYADFKSLFVKGIEKERRDVTSKLSSLYFNSILGKTQFIMRYPNHYGADIINQAIEVYYEIVGYTGTSDELVDLAAKELEDASTDDKLRSIYKLLAALGEVDPNVINYSYTTQELIAAVDEEIIDDIFIHRPVTDLIIPSDLDWYRQSA